MKRTTLVMLGRNTPSTINPSAPAVIGGVGGSGTRVVTEILMGLGYFMGDRNNSAHDNLWFRFLLKRPEWFMSSMRDRPGEIREGLDVFTYAMIGMGDRPPGADRFVMRAVAEQRWRGMKRLRKLLFRKQPDLSSYAGWGWKEPNTHLYLDVLADFYPGLKFIHTIRHGLDMAFSKTRGQLYQWAPFFDLPVPADGEDIPPAFLEFWIRANERALTLGERLGPDRFYLLDFDRMCSAPHEEVTALARFLGVEASEERMSELAALPRTPRSKGRYRDHDLGVFRPEQLAGVRKLGFEVEDGAMPYQA